MSLRLCLTCGHVGCGDSSPNHHATQHFHETGHPLFRALGPDEDWVWCYVDRVRVHPGELEDRGAPRLPPDLNVHA